MTEPYDFDAAPEHVRSYHEGPLVFVLAYEASHTMGHILSPQREAELLQQVGFRPKGIFYLEFYVSVGSYRVRLIAIPVLALVLLGVLLVRSS